MLNKIRNVLLIIMTASILPVVFINCTKTSETLGRDDVKTQGIEQVGNDAFEFEGVSYPVESYKLTKDGKPIFFQVIPGCRDKCPVVIISLPYHGSPWTQDPDDLRWSNQFPNGGLVPDVDGPNYVQGSNQQIAYYHSSLPDAIGFGGTFLPSKVTVILVYNRFYLGRKMNNYVEDFVTVVNSLYQFPYVDINKMGFLGSSLGGFVAFHSSQFTEKKPVAIAGITPLINLESEEIEMSTVSLRITSNPLLLQSSQNFFNSYLRRINGVDLTQFNSQNLAKKNGVSDFLVIHDSWDTIVSISQFNEFKALRPVDGFIFQHAEPINYNLFKMDHSQPSEGFTNNKIIPIYSSYLLSRLKLPSEEKVIYYLSSDFLTGIAEIKAAQARGQDIAWIRNFFDDLCVGGFTLKDLSTKGNLGLLTGRQMAGGLIVNVWHQPTTVENACDYLQNNPHIFN